MIYSHEGAEYKMKLPTYDSDTNILRQDITRGAIPTRITDTSAFKTCKKTATDQVQLSKCRKYK